jgi:hypothetical protein
VKVGTKDQLGDTFFTTKPLPAEAFNKYQDWMGVIDGGIKVKSEKLLI